MIDDDGDGEQPPRYTVYGRSQQGSRRTPPGASRASGSGGRGGSGARQGGERPYKLYRSKPRSPIARLRGDSELDALKDAGRDAGAGGSGAGGRGARGERGSGGERRGGDGRRRITPKRVILGLLIAIVGWLLLSLVLFLISAEIERGNVPDSAKRALASAGPMPFSANNILVLGSDARPKGSKEPGAAASGQRSDTIMLIRAGGGASSRLSIPRDTVVPIPGHGTTKINAAYSFGGPALSIKTIEQYLGIEINHLVEVNFENFPSFIDALGGVTVSTGCVKSDISGGTKNGGWSLRLKRGSHHLNGTDALTLARTRHNQCNPNENDLTRAKRQQKILAGMKSQLTSPGAFFRLPWISWTAPKAIRTDMGGPSLLGLFTALAVSGSPPPRILKPSGPVTLPDGELGLQVSEAEKRRAVARFMKG